MSLLAYCIVSKFSCSVSGPYIRRINNDAREDEMEDNMQAVGSMLGNLKNMAQDMGGEIEREKVSDGHGV